MSVNVFIFTSFLVRELEIIKFCLTLNLSETYLHSASGCVFTGNLPMCRKRLLGRASFPVVALI